MAEAGRPSQRNPYRPLRRVADGVHCVDGLWGRSPMGRRMTLLDLGGGELAVHGAIRMDEDDMAALDALGRVALIVVPNPMHASEGPWYAERYPAARLFAPAGLRGKLARHGRVDGAIDGEWPETLRGALDARVVDGLRFPETVCLHVRSRTLVLTDLCFHFGPDAFRGLARPLMRLNGVIDRFGPSRLLRYVLTRDRAALAEAVRAILRWDFDRVVVSHGRVLERDGKARVAEAFRYLLGANAR